MPVLIDPFGEQFLGSCAVRAAQHPHVRRVRARPVLLLTLPRYCQLLKPPHPVARRVLDSTDIRECGMRDVGAKGTLARGEQLPSWGGFMRRSEREGEREREREREGVGSAREAGERTSNLSARSAFKSVWLEMDFDAARSSTLLRGSTATHSSRVHGRTSSLSAMRPRPSIATHPRVSFTAKGS